MLLHTVRNRSRACTRAQPRTGFMVGRAGHKLGESCPHLGNGPVIPRNGPVIPRNGPLIPGNGPLIPRNGPLIPRNGPLIPRNGPLIPRNGPSIPRPERPIPVDLNLSRALFASGHVATMGLVRSLGQAIAEETGWQNADGPGVPRPPAQRPGRREGRVSVWRAG